MKSVILALLLLILMSNNYSLKSKFFIGHVHVVNKNKTVGYTIIWNIMAADNNDAKRLFNQAVLYYYPQNEWEWDLSTYTVFRYDDKNFLSEENPYRR